VPLFRPPYGERRADSGEFFANQRLRVVLWNIDSQDWRDTVLADDAASRVMTLMLLWRHGIVLFHDVYPKAQTAVPQLAAWAARVGVHWLDCHRISSVRRQ
jgi:peptidoglycan/xylan/chitin deacetylase (PgdA/CDA1 family)